MSECYTPSPSRIETLLETPETQMCGLPSQLRIRMVLMATSIPHSGGTTTELVMQYCKSACRSGGVSPTPSASSHGMDVPNHCFEGPIPGGPVVSGML